MEYVAVSGGGATNTDGMVESLKAYGPFIGAGLVLLMGAIWLFGRKG